MTARDGQKPLRILAGSLLWAGLVSNCQAQSPACSGTAGTAPGAPGCPAAIWVRKDCPEGCPRFPPGAIPRPAGAYLRQWQAVQVAKANLDDFVLYGNEWYNGGSYPGPAGRRHLMQIAKRLASGPFPVVIEPDLLPEKDEARRKFVVGYLAQYGFRDAHLRVVVDFPIAEGLNGDEASRAYLRMISGGQGGGGLGAGGLGGATLGVPPSGGFGTVR
jgi:hypothetical protein